jgi:hypothetical protein
MTRCHAAALLGGLLMHASALYGQSFMDPRAIGIGAAMVAGRDSRAFAWNPASLVQIRDWDFSVVTYTPVAAGKAGLVFHGMTLGKRFLESEAVALEYAPGTQLHLVVPPTLTISGGATPVSNGREIRYEEPGSIGYAHRFSAALSIGIAGRYRRERITDTRITLVEQDSIPLLPVSITQSLEASTWLADAGLLWMPTDKFSLGLSGRNLVRLTGTSLPDSLGRYRLPRAATAAIGALYRPVTGWRLAGQVCTNGTATLGSEWSPGLGFSLRGALYANRTEDPPLAAFSFGVGWAYEFLEADASYLRFTNRDRHSGVVSLAEFDASEIGSLDFNPYVRDRVSFSVKAMFGNIREALARIEAVELFGAVYPSSFEVFAYRPIGKARIRNIADKPIEARVSFFVDRFMDAPTESRSVTVAPGATAEVELTAVFNDRVRSVAKMMIREANVLVTATPAETFDDRTSTPVLFRGKNEWDGSAESLRFFVTPDDPDVLRSSRDILLREHDALASAGAGMEAFVKSRTLINGFGGKLMYVADPRLSADYVQYPAETLSLRGGDCDDMTVCFASLLGSIGVATAFVDVVPPGDPGRSHIYLLFDTGLEARNGASVSENSKRYVLRKGKSSRETVWIPIETTVITRGFDEAWTAGAQQYFDDVELGLGLARGWVRIVDVN